MAYFLQLQEFLSKKACFLSKDKGQKATKAGERSAQGGLSPLQSTGLDAVGLRNGLFFASTRVPQQEGLLSPKNEG